MGVFHKSVVSAVVAVGVLLASTGAAADTTTILPESQTPIRAHEPAQVCIRGAVPARCADVPPGVYVPEGRWEALDVEMRRLQDQETRLSAENKSLRESAGSWQPGWYTLTATLLTGLVGGWYLHEKL